MKFRHIWNVLLIAAGMFICAASAPNIVRQFQTVMRHLGGGSTVPTGLTWLTSMTGQLAFELLLLAYLGSWAWNLIGPKLWWFFTISTALLLVGTAGAAILDYIDLHAVVFAYLKFAVSVCAMAFPIVFLRIGWIGLIRRLF